MRWGSVVLLLVFLVTPGAAAWSASISSSSEGVSLRSSLLLAGAITARVEGGSLGAPFVDGLTFDVPATVAMCLDSGGEPQSESRACEPTTGARLYFLAGGAIMLANGQAASILESPATAAALGGRNVTLNQFDVGPGVYAGGATVVTSASPTLALRPLGSEASIEVRGNEGFRTYNGSAFTLYISGVNETRLEARGAFVGGNAPSVELSRAGIRAAETGIRVSDLYDLLRAIQPPERADRRADLAEAFGPFQLVPPLLDGAAAARANLTLNDEARGAFTFVRLTDLSVAHADGNWTGEGNATYLVDDEIVAPAQGDTPRFPWWLPIILILGAITARVLTPREPARRRARILGQLVRIAGIALVCFLAALALAPLLGFSPLLDVRGLSLRSRTQLALLCAGMALTAWLALGLASESLARSAFAWRDRPRAVLIPVMVGLVVAAAFLLLATPTLLSFVARFVRL